MKIFCQLPLSSSICEKDCFCQTFVLYCFYYSFISDFIRFVLIWVLFLAFDIVSISDILLYCDNDVVARNSAKLKMKWIGTRSNDACDKSVEYSSRYQFL